MKYIWVHPKKLHKWFPHADYTVFYGTESEYRELWKKISPVVDVDQKVKESAKFKRCIT
jgi:hypothetical protein